MDCSLGLLDRLARPFALGTGLQAQGGEIGFAARLFRLLHQLGRLGHRGLDLVDFSHIDNAVEIIKNRKIQSRNKATIKGDAAGNVVHLRNDAHDYARFYFRPHTPTQFYNEFLGKNTSDGYDSKNYGWVSWYEKARGLGFPKCPIPIFFRFSLQEVLFKDKKSNVVSAMEICKLVQRNLVV